MAVADDHSLGGRPRPAVRDHDAASPGAPGAPGPCHLDLDPDPDPDPLRTLVFSASER